MANKGTLKTQETAQRDFDENVLGETADLPVQFSVGRSACSMTSTSTGVFSDRRRNPSCSWTAVKIDTPSKAGRALSGTQCNLKLKIPSNPVPLTTGRSLAWALPRFGADGPG